MLNAPRKNPKTDRDSRSPTPSGISKGPLCDNAFNNKPPTVPSSLVLPAITPKLFKYVSDLGCRDNLIFHFSFAADEKKKAVFILDALQSSFSLKFHGCYISKGYFWEQSFKPANEEFNWIVTLKIRKPGNILLNTICEYAISNGFAESALYLIPWRELTIVKCEYKLNKSIVQR